MIFTCTPEFNKRLGITAEGMRALRLEMLGLDIQPVMAIIDNKVNFLETHGDKELLRQGLDRVEYVVATTNSEAVFEPAALWASVIAKLKADDLLAPGLHVPGVWIMTSFEDGLTTSAAATLRELKSLTGVEFDLHMVYSHIKRVDFWHNDFVPVKKTAATLSINIPFEGYEGSYLEVQGGWTTTNRRDRALFFNPKDSTHRIVVEDSSQRARSTVMFRTTKMTVMELRDALKTSGLLEDEAK